MTGGDEAWWKDEEFPDVFTSKAIEFINKNKDNPFFLFFSFHDIHVPRLPNERFHGKSKMGPRGDAIVQMDWMTGEIVSELEKLGLDNNTLIIFTSDNGPVLNDGYEDFAVERLGNHKPGGQYRGGKYSAFEAGTRVPTIAYWPGTIKPDVSDALLSQVDFLSSLASLTGVELNTSEGLDSENLIQALLGQSPDGRELMLEESYTLCLKSKKWKYIAPIPEDKTLPKWLSNKDIETGFSYDPQLYNLDKDPSEMVNVAADYPEVVANMQKKLSEIVELKAPVQ